MSDLAVLAVTGSLFYAQRASFIVAAGPRIPDAWQRLLGHARPAVVAALAVSLTWPAGATTPDGRALAVGIAGLLAARRGLLASVLAGAAVLTVLAALS